MKVAFLGPEGTYTHEAVLQQFGKEPNLTILPQSTIGACFDVLNSRDVDYAVVPFENSTNGQVVFTYDLLRDWFISDTKASKPPFRIVGEQYVAIHHYLLSKAADKSEIKTIYSHPQVWGQVTKALKVFKDCAKIDANSTAEAAEFVVEDSTGTIACISSKMCARLKSLPILEAEIEDNPRNSTRFLILGSSDLNDQQDDKSDDSCIASSITSIMFTLNHDDPGALMAALDSFRFYKINLTSIASRPSGERQWQYVFFVEAEGSIHSEKMKLATKKLHECCMSVVVLGSFTRSWSYST
ncbi:hypothetical protein CJJ07_004782 [Candidozyma auris]|nr:hypothetical protein CJJ07_004782 [[Candida] auris]